MRPSPLMQCIRNRLVSNLWLLHYPKSHFHTQNKENMGGLPIGLFARIAVLIAISKGIVPRKRLLMATKGDTMLIRDSFITIIHPQGSLKGKAALSDLVSLRLDNLKPLRFILMLLLILLPGLQVLIKMLMLIIALTPPNLNGFGW